MQKCASQEYGEKTRLLSLAHFLTRHKHECHGCSLDDVGRRQGHLEHGHPPPSQGVETLLGPEQGEDDWGLGEATERGEGGVATQVEVQLEAHLRGDGHAQLGIQADVKLVLVAGRGGRRRSQLGSLTRIPPVRVQEVGEGGDEGGALAARRQVHSAGR